MIIFPNKPGVFHIFLFTIGIHRLDLHGFQWLRESTAETGSNLDEAMLSQECCHDSWFHYVLFAISFGSTMSLCVYMCIMVYHINVLCGIMFHYMQITPITMFCFFLRFDSFDLRIGRFQGLWRRWTAWTLRACWVVVKTWSCRTGWTEDSGRVEI